YSNPVLSYFMSRLGAYTVDRKKTSAIYKATLKNYSTVILREGIHSIFFPGGGRSRSGAIESKIKLGLLGTGLDAQIEGLKAGKPNPNVFVVPMVVSYHFVLEAASLVEDYLIESGRHRLIITDDESWQYSKVLQFFWKAFSAQSSFTARVGRPLDIFGNFVDEEGRSLGPNGTTIDPRKLLTTRGELRAEPQRDREYTRELGMRLSERFHRENTVLSSHLVAFTLFETLRKKYPDLDLYRFLRLSLPQRSITEEEFMQAAEHYHAEVKGLADRGYLYLAPELQTSNMETWVKEGLSQVGLYHEVAVIRRRDGAVWTEDMNLLYYYRNRLSGYGISLLALHGGARRTFGDLDPKGFLA
ncbi:MAG TPA: glycerol-3-phosphate acyltransferase, partial [Bdellovibrionota bacterium]|nr:glycerol-3-phosphate acyltransferase [Bdellovibrionota bacterium]